jgi:hypothetical protein
MQAFFRKSLAENLSCKFVIYFSAFRLEDDAAKGILLTQITKMFFIIVFYLLAGIKLTE